MISDKISVSRVSDFTEISSIMLNPNLKDQHQSSAKKVRKLSINDSHAFLSPDVRSETSKLKANLDRQSHTSLNKEALNALGHQTPTDRKLKDYAESLKSGVLSAHRRKGLLGDDDDQKSLNRFPSIQKSRVGSQHFMEDIMSNRSRKSLLSNV